MGCFTKTIMADSYGAWIASFFPFSLFTPKTIKSTKTIKPTKTTYQDPKIQESIEKPQPLRRSSRSMKTTKREGFVYY